MRAPPSSSLSSSPPVPSSSLSSSSSFPPNPSLPLAAPPVPEPVPQRIPPSAPSSSPDSPGVELLSVTVSIDGSGALGRRGGGCRMGSSRGTKRPAATRWYCSASARNDDTRTASDARSISNSPSSWPLSRRAARCSALTCACNSSRLVRRVPRHWSAFISYELLDTSNERKRGVWYGISYCRR